MDALVQSFFADPMYYIGFCFAFVAAIAFLAFLRGFLTGSPHLFTMNGHEGHLGHSRFRATWGVTGLFGLIIAWEALRTLAAWLGIGSAAPHSLWVLLVAYVIIGLILWVAFAVKDGVTAKH